MTRPLRQTVVHQLEELFSRSRTNVFVLEQLEHELQHRKVPRAVALLEEVQAAISGAREGGGLGPARPPEPHPPKTTKRPQPTSDSDADDLVAPARPVREVPPMTVEDSLKALRATDSSAWESIEQTRRLLVQKSSPSRMSTMNSDERVQALGEARRVNSAYVTLSRIRGEGR